MLNRALDSGIARCGVVEVCGVFSATTIDFVKSTIGAARLSIALINADSDRTSLLPCSPEAPAVGVDCAVGGGAVGVGGVAVGAIAGVAIGSGVVGGGAVGGGTVGDNQKAHLMFFAILW